MKYDRIAYFLRQIPRSDHPALPLQAIVSPDEVLFCVGIAHMLHLLGCITYDDASQTLRATSQTANYTLNSLAHYIEQGQPIVQEWRQRGVTQAYDHVFSNGATFLYALEAHRLNHNPHAQPSRHERVAQVLITRYTTPHMPEFLMQYDANASQFQFIGGRAKDTDPDMLTTMTREIAEELSPQLTFKQDYDLDLLIDKLTLPPTLSPTFGALTSYTFTVYHMRHLSVSLQLSPQDKWIPLHQIQTGHITIDQQSHKFTNHDLYTTLDAHIQGGLTTLKSSQT